MGASTEDAIPYVLIVDGDEAPAGFVGELTELLQPPVRVSCSLSAAQLSEQSSDCTHLVVRIGEDKERSFQFISSVSRQHGRPEIIGVGPRHLVTGAVAAMQAGVDAYFSEDEVERIALEINSTHAITRQTHVPMVTRDPGMISVARTGTILAPSQMPVLITGETGTGKELLAELIHSASNRSGEFVVENVAGLDDALFSDALFGHVRGAYTGAVGDRMGLLERAAGGTLVLDEIGDITPASQVKLLRLLESGAYYPLGADKERLSSARIILATNRDLLELVRKGSFRMDLYFRLSPFHLHIPPLRARRRDIPVLARHFAASFARDMGTEVPELSSQMLDLLERYDYPGNVRELQSVVVSVVSHARDGRIGEAGLLSLVQSLLHSSGQISVDSPALVSFAKELPTIDELTDLLIDEAMRRADGNQSDAARMLGVSPSMINKRLQQRRSS